MLTHRREKQRLQRPQTAAIFRISVTFVFDGLFPSSLPAAILGPEMAAGSGLETRLCPFMIMQQQAFIAVCLWFNHASNN